MQSALLQLPAHFGIIDAFDLLFKAHKIFNMDFNPDISNAMNFVQTFIYKMQDGQKQPSMLMKEVFNPISD